MRALFAFSDWKVACFFESQTSQCSSLVDPHELAPLSHYIIDTACTAGGNKELEACLEQKRKDYAEALPVHRFLLWAAASCSQAMKQFAVIVLKKKLRREQLQPLAYLHVKEGGKRGVGQGGSSTGGI